MSTSLCLIVWNEVEGCKIDVPLLPREAFDEIYAIDGGSSDGTVEYLESQEIKVYKQRAKGLNAAYIDARKRSACENVAVFFPKGTIDPKSLELFLPKLMSGYELVVASRNLPESRNEEDGRLFKPRKWFVTLLAVVSVIFWKKEGNSIWDVLHGVKAFSNKAFDEMNILNHGLSIDIEMVARSYKKKIKRCEIPVKEKPRQFGDTHFAAFATGRKLLKYMVCEMFRSK